MIGWVNVTAFLMARSADGTKALSRIHFIGLASRAAVFKFSYVSEHKGDR
jgi:hypothetical protein